MSELGLYGGFVVVVGGGTTYRVPYFGLKGDYSKMDVLQSITFGNITANSSFAQLGVSSVGKAVGSWNNAVFDFSTSFPAITIPLYQPLRRFTADLVNLDTGVHFT